MWADGHRPPDQVLEGWVQAPCFSRFSVTGSTSTETNDVKERIGAPKGTSDTACYHSAVRIESRRGAPANPDHPLTGAHRGRAEPVKILLKDPGSTPAPGIRADHQQAPVEPVAAARAELHGVFFAARASLISASASAGTFE
jgi:hypothetical protein